MHIVSHLVTLFRLKARWQQQNLTKKFVWTASWWNVAWFRPGSGPGL